MKGKRFLLVSLLAALGINATACGIVPGSSSELVEAGYAGLLVDQYGQDKGVAGAEVVYGKVWYNGWTQDLYIYPTYTRTYPFTKSGDEGSDKDESISFSLGGSPVNLDVSVSYGFNADKLPHFFGTFRQSPDEFRATTLRSALRDCAAQQAGAMGLTPVQLPTKTEALLGNVQTCLQKKFPDVSITAVSLLNPPRLSEAIQQSIDASFKAQQDAATADSNAKKAEAEGRANLAKAEAEAKVIVQQAEAQARANQILSNSITPNTIRMRELENDRARIDKWNGQQAPTIQTPNVQLGGTPAQAAN